MTDAYEQAARLVAEARLADPDEHYPFKTADAKAALKRKDMGPDADTKKDVTGADFTSTRIIEATEAYIAAQEAVVADPSPANRSAYEAATDDLVAARRTHRRERTDADGKPLLNVVGITTADGPLRARRVGEA